MVVLQRPDVRAHMSEMNRRDGCLEADTRNLCMHEAGSIEQMHAKVHAMASPRPSLDSTLLMHDSELHMHLNRWCHAAGHKVERRSLESASARLEGQSPEPDISVASPAGPYSTSPTTAPPHSPTTLFVSLPFSFIRGAQD